MMAEKVYIADVKGTLPFVDDNAVVDQAIKKRAKVLFILLFISAKTKMLSRYAKQKGRPRTTGSMKR